MMVLKTFVTGGTGFIGNSLVRRLIESGRDVTCLVRRTSDISKLKKVGAGLIFGDIRDRHSMEDGIFDCDVVFHLAAWYEFGIWNKRGMFETNVIGTQNVLSLALENNKKVLYCSTAGVLGHSEDSLKKEDSERPEIFTSEYERTKYIANVEAMKYEEKGLDLVAVMPGGVFGPADTSLIGDLLKRYVQGKLRNFIKTDSKFSWVHVDDVVEGFLLAEKQGKTGEAYILTDKYLTMLELLGKAEEFTGIPTPKRLFGLRTAGMLAPFSEVGARIMGKRAFLSREALMMLKRSWVWDSAKARKDLGWHPKDFEARLKSTMEWYVERYGKG